MASGMDTLYDPNSHIDPETRYRACQYSAFAFNRARVEAHEVETGEPNSFIAGKAGDRLHLVYVRVTFDEEQEEGAGLMPGILIDKAREMGAEPHVVRVHYRKKVRGPGIEYFGHDELERAFKSGDYWRRALIGKRTARDYLNLVKRRLSKLEVKIECWQSGEPPWKDQPEAILSPEEKELRKLFGEEDWKLDPQKYPGHVFLTLRVDTFPPQIADNYISIRELTLSATYSDRHAIFTNYDGVWECWPGDEPAIEVVHEDGLVVWRDRTVRPMRVGVFNRKEYRSEILSKVRHALVLQREMGSEAFLGAGDRREMVEDALCRAEGDENK